MARDTTNQLARTLRERDLLYLFVGSVIGSGIFLTPGIILRQLSGSVGYALLVWLLGGILSLVGALTYAELSAANPEAGGLYCYIRDAFGRLSAFLYGWCLFLVIASATIAALAHAFTKYLQQIIPLSEFQASLVVILMIAAVTAVNVWGTRKSSDLQNVTTLIKVGIIVGLGSILLALGFWHGKHAGEISAAMGSSQSGAALFSNFGLAMITVLWAYEGWQFGTYSAGEGLYLFAVVSYLVALGPADAAASDTIAATAATRVMGAWAGKLVACTILISTFSSTNSVMLTAPRVFYAMAKDELFFKKLAHVHPRFGTPAVAVLALGAWSCILASVGEFAKLANGAIFIGWIFYGLGAAAIFPIRRATKGKEVPYRVPGYPFTPLLFVGAALAIVGNAIFAASKNPGEFTYLLAALALMALGLPGYFFWSRRRSSQMPV